MKKNNQQGQKPQDEEIIWQPVSRLRDIGEIIDKAVKDAGNQELLLMEGTHSPDLFSDATIWGIKKVHTEKLAFIDIYLQQIKRWKKEITSREDHFELIHLTEQCKKLKVLVTSILVLADEIGRKTSNRVMNMDDAEQGL